MTQECTVEKTTVHLKTLDDRVGGERVLALNPVVVRIEGGAVTIKGNEFLIRAAPADQGRDFVGIDKPGIGLPVAPLNYGLVEARQEIFEVA
ncbi:hypothetical protein [Ferrimicrobium acidiphilum]|uniref:hypothetical protein n=1 Tax=Ferrimicrobium acidiphilum TaxID=121039 RepID=UPI0014702DEC|nr:hypothetical protein [Ferrimicrobium acidiphilum]